MTDTLFTLAGDPAAAIGVVGSAALGLGYQAVVQPDGRHRFSRGDLQSSVMVGGIAGSRFYVEFEIEFGTDASGQLTAKVERGSRSLFKGGRIGVGIADDSYRQLVDTIGRAVSDAGIYRGSIEVD